MVSFHWSYGVRCLWSAEAVASRSHQDVERHHCVPGPKALADMTVLKHGAGGSNMYHSRLCLPLSLLGAFGAREEFILAVFS
jgi:hypothetical protein